MSLDPSMMMAAGMGVSAISSLQGGIAQSSALKQQADWQAGQLDYNARLGELRAADATDRGSKAAGLRMNQGRQQVGSQKASLASQGVSVSSGSAADILDQTRTVSEQDAARIKSNAWQEAWGFKTQADNDRGNAGMTRRSGKNSSENSLLTGGLNFLEKASQSAYYALA